MTEDKYRKVFNYLYRITNLINHKIYIGCHQTDNLDDGYMGSGTWIKYALNKYGQENFKKEILEYFLDAESMFNTEAKMVTREFIKDTNNYNLSEGGRGGFKGEECYNNPSRNNKLSLANRGIVSAKTIDGQIIRIPKTDPRFITKELVGHTKGKTALKDAVGNILIVDVNDTRYLSGELVGFSKGIAMVKDQDGNTYRISKDDPRILSGELVGITKGLIQTIDSNEKRRVAMLGRKMPQPMVICEFCGKSTSKTNIIRWHKNCG